MVAQGRFDEEGAAARFQHAEDLGKEGADIGDVVDDRRTEAGIEDRVPEAGFIRAVRRKGQRHGGCDTKALQMLAAEFEHAGRHIGQHRLVDGAMRDHRTGEAARSAADLDDRAE
jgi:hypothetical protein